MSNYWLVLSEYGTLKDLLSPFFGPFYYSNKIRYDPKFVEFVKSSYNTFITMQDCYNILLILYNKYFNKVVETNREMTRRRHKNKLRAKNNAQKLYDIMYGESGTLSISNIPYYARFYISLNNNREELKQYANHEWCTVGMRIDQNIVLVDNSTKYYIKLPFFIALHPTFIEIIKSGDRSAVIDFLEKNWPPNFGYSYNSIIFEDAKFKIATLQNGKNIHFRVYQKNGAEEIDYHHNHEWIVDRHVYIRDQDADAHYKYMYENTPHFDIKNGKLYHRVEYNTLGEYDLDK